MLSGVGVVAGGVPAWANSPVSVGAFGQRSADQPPLTVVTAEEARNWVLILAKTHPFAEVRVSAWNALRSTRGADAIAEWLAPGGGFDYAKQRARETRSRNRAFCERVLRTHTVEFSPQVHEAAERALKGTAADQAAFVATGYADAQRRDRSSREADTQHKYEVAAHDRDFVRMRAEHDPGEQVRVAAQWALRPGAGDADIAEFFGYGWTAGAALDLEGFRARVADAEVLRRHTLSRLIKEAEAAEAALQGAADAAKARAEAERAWRAVAEHADAARKAWLAEQSTAMAQAENWKNVVNAARANPGDVWKNIADTAVASQDAWAKEQALAGEAVRFWLDLSTRAQENGDRLKS
ncbi:hypothetical protein [Streptomyces orinoci]|uniref:Uncharacterized protein n=1 Tax=Streptomyces orinoci TaxID=67339 RepID=A0ABV3JT32_STRON